MVGSHHGGVERGAASTHRLRPRRGAHLLSAGHEVVPAAEAGPVPAQQDHVHRGVQIRPFDSFHEPPQQCGHDPVAPLGPVQRDPRDPVAGLEEDGLGLGHGRQH